MYNLSKKYLKAIFILGLLFSVPNEHVYSQDILNKKISSFKVENKNIAYAVKELSFITKVPICLEIDFRGINLTSPDEISLELKEITLHEALNILIKKDKDSYWQEEKGIINIVPVRTKNDSKYPLNKTVEEFDVVNLNRDKIIDKLLSVFPKDPMAVTSLFYNLHNRSRDDGLYTFKLKKTTIRGILNEVVRNEGDAIWIYNRVGFLNIYNFEDLDMSQFGEIPFKKEDLEKPFYI